MIIHANDSIEFKEKRKKKREQKIQLKRRKRNPLAAQLYELGHSIIEDKKERGGAKNLLKEIEKDIYNE